jgi:hypothetical protein
LGGAGLAGAGGAGGGGHVIVETNFRVSVCCTQFSDRQRQHTRLILAHLISSPP